jgi:hypothetical protein
MHTEFQLEGLKERNLRDLSMDEHNIIVLTVVAFEDMV